MKQTWKIPGRIVFLSSVFLFTVALLSFLRICFYLYFRPEATSTISLPVLHAMYLGFKFDARLAAVLCLSILLFSWVRGIDLAKAGFGRKLWIGYLVLAYAFILVLYFVDFGTYSYLRTRLNGSLLVFLDNPWISAHMVITSYPVVWLGLLIAASMAGLYYFLNKSASLILDGQPASSRPGRKQASLWYVLLVFLLLLGAFGKIGRRPLVWSEAFFSRDMFVNQVALNPILYFIDTLGQHQKNFDLDLTRKYYPFLADHLGVKNKDTSGFSLQRKIVPRARVIGQPNVVIILLESFAAYKVGALGNPLPATPCFDGLAKNGMMFTNYYVPVQNTPRSIFSALFGIPDVNLDVSASQPDLINQKTILNSFAGYEKYYFVGGDPSWGNLGGFLASNIDELQTYSQSSFKSKAKDTWGISDVDLFRETNELLKTKSKQPFFALIQTSGHHRPYNFPKQEGSFRPIEVDANQLKKNGFPSSNAFNSLRYLDYSLCTYFEAARNEPYFKNTIFLLMGDHGLNDGILDMDSKLGEISLSAFHVPLLLYAPDLGIRGQINNQVASELDLLPTIAAYLGRSPMNDKLGRDLFDPAYKGTASAFTFSAWGSRPSIGLVQGNFYLIAEINGRSTLFLVNQGQVQDVTGNYPEQAKRMTELALGYYETSRYLMYHNQTEKNETIKK